MNEDRIAAFPLSRAQSTAGLRFDGEAGLWWTSRTIAGETIRFEAPTQAEVRQLVTMAVGQQLSALNARCETQASPVPSCVPPSRASFGERLLQRMRALPRTLKE